MIEISFQHTMLFRFSYVSFKVSLKYTQKAGYSEESLLFESVPILHQLRSLMMNLAEAIDNVVQFFL